MVELSTTHNGSVKPAWSAGILSASVHAAAGRAPVLNRAGLPGLYAACALLGLARNIPAEPWLGVALNDTAAIETILRTHGLLPMAARV